MTALPELGGVRKHHPAQQGVPNSDLARQNIPQPLRPMFDMEPATSDLVGRDGSAVIVPVVEDYTAIARGIRLILNEEKRIGADEGGLP